MTNRLFEKIFDFFFKTKEYIFYSLKAKDEYSVHSPLVFDFYTTAVKNSKLSLKEKIGKYFSSFAIEDCNSFSLINSKLQEESDNIIIIIENIHSNIRNHKQWKKICELNDIFISIDFFSLGLIIKSSKLIKRQHYILWK